MKALATNLIRAGEYVQRFGLRGLLIAAEHQVKFRMMSGEARTTNIPGYGEISLRPKTSDLATFREIFVNQDYDLDAHGIRDLAQGKYDAIRAAGRRPLIVDAGANVGLATRQFKHFFPEADVIAIEPADDSLAIARDNTKGLSGVTFRKAAIWKEDTTVFLEDSVDASARRVGEGSGGGEGVDAITMTTLLDGREEDLFILKMDIEGAESVIFGEDGESADWLRQAPIVFIEGHDGMSNDFGSLAGLLAHKNYRDGRITTTGPALIIVPRSSFDA